MNASQPEAKSKPGLELLQLFMLERREDESGVSGTGVVAYGVVLPSGKAVLEWVTELRSVALYDSLQVLEDIHSHGGRTRVRMINSLK